MSAVGPVHLSTEESAWLRVLVWLQFIGATILAIDIVAELPDLRGPMNRAWLAVLLHFAAEVLALGLLGWGVVVARRLTRRLADDRARQASKLTALQRGFDDTIQARFNRWCLSEAERDVALLTLRGMRIAEIAAARKRQPGTVKAQLSAVFRKSGAATRNELIGLFMDDLLDVGIKGSPVPIPVRHRPPAP